MLDLATHAALAAIRRRNRRATAFVAAFRAGMDHPQGVTIFDVAEDYGYPTQQVDEATVEIDTRTSTIVVVDLDSGSVTTRQRPRSNAS